MLGYREETILQANGLNSTSSAKYRYKKVKSISISNDLKYFEYISWKINVKTAN